MITSNKTKTANVVVSFITRPVEEVISFINGGNRTNNSYLFRIPNDNIIKFTHSYNFNKSEGDDIGTKITLELIDLENVFESSLFGNSGELPYSDATLKKLRQQAYDELIRRIKIKKVLDNLDFSDFRDDIPFDENAPEDQIQRSFRYGNIFKPGSTLENKIQSGLANEGLSDADKVAVSIISKLKEKKVFFTEPVMNLVPTGPAGGPEGRLIARPTGESLEKIKEKSTSSIYDDFSLNVTDASVLPTPYFYFYYGIGDYAPQWTGPVAAQMTNARYNYSAESGKKSIELEFTTTYNFPAFSKLAMDKRGVLVDVPPKFVAAQIVKPVVLPSQTQVNFFTNTTTTINPIKYAPTPEGIMFDHTHLAIKNVISRYIKDVTHEDINTLVLLPDLNELVSQVLLNYFNAYTTENSENIFEVDALRTNAYAKFFQDLGFRTRLIPAYNIKGIKKTVTQADLTNLLGGPIDPYESDVVLSTPVSFADEKKITQTFEEISRGPDLYGGPAFNNIILGLAISKDSSENFRKPLERIIQGITNKISTTQMCLEIIDNLEFVKEFKSYLQKSKDPAVKQYGYDMNPNMPLVIFGDRFIIEKYLYGKKFYEIKQIIESKTVTKGKDVDQGLSFKQRLDQWAVNQKAADKYLHPFDNEIFCSNGFSYVTNIAAKYFLKFNPASDYVFQNNFYAYPKGDFELPPKTEERLRSAAVPIFKSGVYESNILSLDLNLNDYYFSMLRSVWQGKDTLNLITDSNAPIVDVSSLDAFDPATVNKLKEVLGILDDKSGSYFVQTITPAEEIRLESIFAELASDNNFNSPLIANEKKSEQLYLLITYLQQQLMAAQEKAWPGSTLGPLKSKINIIVGSHESINPYIQYLNMFSRVVNNSFVGYVKTLPAFYLAGTAFSLPPIILLLEETNLPPYDRKNYITRAFNGMWSILGYKHTITQDEMSSEFWVVKDIRLEIPLMIQPRGK